MRSAQLAICRGLLAPSCPGNDKNKETRSKLLEPEGRRQVGSAAKALAPVPLVVSLSPLPGLTGTHAAAPEARQEGIVLVVAAAATSFGPAARTGTSEEEREE